MFCDVTLYQMSSSGRSVQSLGITHPKIQRHIPGDLNPQPDRCKKHFYRIIRLSLVSIFQKNLVTVFNPTPLLSEGQEGKSRETQNKAIPFLKSEEL